MPAAEDAAAIPKYRAVIYLCGTEGKQLSDAEKRCQEYAARFGWHVVESIYDHGRKASLDQLLPKVSGLGAQIILTDTLDMISPDQEIRDDLMTEIERSEYILQPVSAPIPPVKSSPQGTLTAASPGLRQGEQIHDGHQR